MSREHGVENCGKPGTAGDRGTVTNCTVANEIASARRVEGAQAPSTAAGALAAPGAVRIFMPMPLPLFSSIRAARRWRPTSLGAFSRAVIALAFLAVGACGGDSTGVGDTAGLPAPGRWYATMFDSRLVPFQYGDMRLDSAWHVIDASGNTRLFVASSDERFVVTVDTIDGRFVRANDGGAIQLLYLSGSGDPYPPSPVTVNRDSVTVEDGATHLMDVFIPQR